MERRPDSRVKRPPGAELLLLVAVERSSRKGGGGARRSVWQVIICFACDKIRSKPDMLSHIDTRRLQLKCDAC